MLFGKTDGIFDLSEKRSDSEPDEEGNEETPPREVECSHVRTREVTQLNLGRLIVLLWVDSKYVRIILFVSLILLSLTSNWIRSSLDYIKVVKKKANLLLLNQPF